jgi:hypothetical protein
MPDQDGNLPAGSLQFDTVAPVSTVGAAAGVTCANCHQRIDTEYYEANGHAVCGHCRTALEAATEPPRGMGPTIRAPLFGLGAGIAGAAIYFAVMAIAHLEIGIVAILIGYMVGYAVRRGAGNRGGRRMQIIAVALTYLSVAFAYTPLVIATAWDKAHAPANATASPSAPADTAVPDSEPRSVSILRLAVSIGLIAALPLLVIVGSMPSGLITAAIIFFGMRQAWRMTGRPNLEFMGPYRVGDSRPLPA